MSSIHEDTEPQKPAKMPLPPEEHLVWARQLKDGKEHVSFPKFVAKFKFTTGRTPTANIVVCWTAAKSSNNG